MVRLLFLILTLTGFALAQAPAPNQPAGGGSGGGGGSAITPYTACPVGCSTTVAASGTPYLQTNINQGPGAVAECFDSSHNWQACGVANSGTALVAGDVTVTYSVSPSFIIIYTPSGAGSRGLTGATGSGAVGVSAITFASGMATTASAATGCGGGPCNVYTLTLSGNVTAWTPSTNPAGMTAGQIYYFVFTQPSGGNDTIAVGPSNFVGFPSNTLPLAGNSITTYQCVWTGSACQGQGTTSPYGTGSSVSWAELNTATCPANVPQYASINDSNVTALGSAITSGGGPNLVSAGCFLSGGTWVVTGSAASDVFLSGTLSAIPATCSPGGALFQATDQPSGLQLYACTATNAWTRVAYSQGGPSNPGTCSIGQIFFNTSAFAGSNIYLCTSTDTWTQISGGGGSSAFSAITSATNTTATMHVGSGASLDATGTGTIAATTITGVVVAGNLAKQNVMDSPASCSSVVGTDNYACNLSPAITSYVVGTHYRFNADVGNVGTAGINFNAVGAEVITKAPGGVTTILATNDIRAGQWVDVVWDGTNMQMQSILGNTASATGCIPSGSTGQVITDNGSGGCTSQAGVTIVSNAVAATGGFSSGVTPPAIAWFTGTAGVFGQAAGTCTGTVPSGAGYFCNNSGAPLWMLNSGNLNIPAIAGVLAVVSGKTFTANNTLTLAGTDTTTMTFPTTSATIARTDLAQTFTGIQTFGTPIALGSGGTNGTDAASNGGLIYSSATQYKVLAGTATANQIPLSGSNAAPAWSPYTVPATIAAHQTLVATSTTTIAPKTLPDCQDSSGSHLNYTQSSDAYSCGTSSSGGGAAGSTLFSTTGSTTVTATSPTTLIGTATGSTTVAANTFTAGQVLEVVAQGYYTTPASATSLTITLNIGGTIRLTTGAVVQGTSVTNGTWRLRCMVTTRTIGSSGTQIANCIFESTGVALTPADAAMQVSSAWTIDTTATEAIDVVATWSTATGSPTLTSTNVAAWIPGAPMVSITREMGMHFVNNGSALSGTTVSCSRATYTGTIIGWYLDADISGSATIGVRSVAFGSYTGVAGYSGYTDVTGGGTAPVLSSAVTATFANLTSWTTAVTAGAEICIQLSSPSTITWLNVHLITTGTN